MASSIDITVQGMTCGGCANKVRTVLEGTDGIAGAEIDVASGAVKVLIDGTVPADDLEFAIDEAVTGVGYTVA
ncbi:heavy-metal-associated domain-containing protein [Demequina sp. NBRC 110054]|uniref:heavy-metal-associated domain-containing protein n=1 Tax=Demequina sp. NBRC 110054 TaxID=1570343 RepID=UPI000A05924B|nr:heavy-metal-associated domain-containing protein [Demequina sp. NBRC 110054]